MKFKLIIVIVTYLLSVSVINATPVYSKNGNKLDIYSNIVNLHNFSNNSSRSSETNISFGFKGESKINNQLTGYGQWECNFKEKNEELSSNKIRLAFTGVRFNKLGSFDYGQNNSIVYDVGGFTDVLPGYGGNTWAQTNICMTDSAAGFITYRNSNFFGLINGLNFALQYQRKNHCGNTMFNVVKWWGFSSSYTLSSYLSVAASYAKSNYDATHQISVINYPNTSRENAEVWIIGLRYNRDNLYFGTTYAETHNTGAFASSHISNKAQNLEAVVQYQFDFGLQPSFAYIQSKGRDFTSDRDHYLAKYIEINTSYYLNKSISTYVDYKINLLSDNKCSKNTSIEIMKNIVTAGLIYQF